MRSFSPATVKIVPLALLVGALVTGLLLSQKPTPAIPNVQNTDAKPAAAQKPVAAVNIQVAETETITTPKAAVAEAGPVNKDKIVSSKISWQMGNSKSAAPQIPLNQVIREYEVVEVEQHPESLPEVGETVELPMLKGKKILVNVESMQSNPNGDKTWTGHVDGFGTDYPIIMTYGTTMVFATITTPEGSYTLESKDGSGWLYKNPSEFELSDAGSKDYLEIPDAHKL
ncbi:MAG TPA: hypothetical protein VN030_02635 [Cellvibrio sp.]|nr:hypothetical protein [Cellvibrio sp.]